MLFSSLKSQSLLVFTAFLLFGCGGEVILSDSSGVVVDVADELSFRIKPGKSKRSLVQSMLGSPYLTNENLKLEIYRKDETDKVFLWMRHSDT